MCRNFRSLSLRLRSKNFLCVFLLKFSAYSISPGCSFSNRGSLDVQTYKNRVSEHDKKHLDTTLVQAGRSKKYTQGSVNSVIQRASSLVFDTVEEKTPRATAPKAGCFTAVAAR
jgi:cystathionine beta-lyase